MRTLLARLVLPAAALALLSTCTGLKSGNCGAEGQACCAGQSCNALLRCGEADTCLPCGGQLAACCPGEVCGDGLLCNAGVCADASCAEACVPGAKRCSATFGIDACTQLGKCAQWSALLASCPTGHACVASGSEATCVERCPGACTPNALVCASTGLKKCEAGAAGACPTLQPLADDSTAPTCLAGACDGAWCWESPTPQGLTLVALDGWAIDQFWALDVLGNILRRDGNGWTYEHRAQPLKTVRALTQCGSSAGYLLAVGDNGTVLRRISGGTWLPENVGDAQAQLGAVACTSFLRAFAVGAGGKVFVRDELAGGTWRALASGTTATLRGAAYYYSGGDGYAVGDNGTIVRCRDLNAPSTATCGLESASGVTTRLDAVRANGLSGQIVAVGKGGVLLSRLSQASGWTREAVSVTAEDLTAVAAGPEVDSDFLVVGAKGTVLKGRGSLWNTSGPSGPDLTAVVIPALATAVAAGADGALWFNRADGAASSWARLGGAGPVASGLWGLSGRGSDDLWAVGEGGAVFHRVAETWQEEARGAVQGPLYAVAVAADGGELFAVGDTVGDVALVGTAGRFAAEPLGVTVPLFGVTVDDARAIAVGTSGAWVERLRGPAGAWAPVTQGASGQSLYAVTAQVVNGLAVEVTAVGANCAMVTKSSAGFASVTVPGCSGDALLAAWEGADGELLLGGENAFVTRRVGGNWTREYLGSTLERVLAVAKSGTRSWAACEFGELYSRAGGGWQVEQPRFFRASLRGAWANAFGDVWLGGTGGTVLHGR